MNTEATEFEMRFSTKLIDLGTMLTNYSEIVNQKVNEMSKIIETLQKETKSQKEELESLEPKKE